jgi:chlorite dismutase
MKMADEQPREGHGQGHPAAGHGESAQAGHPGGHPAAAASHAGSGAGAAQPGAGAAQRPEQKVSGYAQFIFYKLDLAWHRLDDGLREENVRQFVAATEEASGIDVKAYSTVGFRHDVDFFLWNRTGSLLELQQFAARLGHTGLGKYLHVQHLYTSLYRESPYPKLKDHEPPELKCPKFLFVYPFVKVRAWYYLSMEERKKAMMEHIAVGHRFDKVAINTSYCFGLGDHEFVVAFDTDHPDEFEALVRKLRETEASKYTLKDTPIFMGSRGTVQEVLKLAV